MSLAKKPRRRWVCAIPVGGYKIDWDYFPRCLLFWGKTLPFWALVLHSLGHFGLCMYDTNERLLKLGLLYSAKDGGILTWQWRFWHSSPLAREIKQGR